MTDKTIHLLEYKKICKTLKDQRLKLDLTQIDVAKKLKKPQSYVSKYESCERRLDILEIKKIIKILDMSFDDLF